MNYIFRSPTVFDCRRYLIYDTGHTFAFPQQNSTAVTAHLRFVKNDLQALSIQFLNFKAFKLRLVFCGLRHNINRAVFGVLFVTNAVKQKLL